MAQADSTTPGGAVVCGVDEFEEAQAVIDVGGELALRLGARLHVVHAAPEPWVSERPAATHPERRAEAEQFERAGHMRTVLGNLRIADEVEATTSVEFGDPAAVLTRTARAAGADLIVVGSNGAGRFERAMIGSTAVDLSRVAPCPVTVVPGAPAAWSGEAVLCGVDESEASVVALATARDLAARLGLELVAVTIREGDEGRPVEGAELVEPAGSPAETLGKLAAQRGASLIVVGSRGRGALSGALLGSVSQDLIARADRPVVVVPPGDA